MPLQKRNKAKQRACLSNEQHLLFPCNVAKSSAVLPFCEGERTENGLRINKSNVYGGWGHFKDASTCLPNSTVRPYFPFTRLASRTWRKPRSSMNLNLIRNHSYYPYPECNPNEQHVSYANSSPSPAHHQVLNGGTGTISQQQLHNLFVPIDACLVKSRVAKLHARNSGRKSDKSWDVKTRPSTWIQTHTYALNAHCFLIDLEPLLKQQFYLAGWHYHLSLFPRTCQGAQPVTNTQCEPRLI